MKKIFQKRFVIAIMGFAVLSVLICLALWLIYHKTISLNMELPTAFYAKTAQNYVLQGQQTVIQIQGEIHKKWFQQPYFEGIIWAEGMDEGMKASGQSSQRCEIHTDLNSQLEFFVYPYPPAESGSTHAVCYVYLNRERNLFILQPGASGANTREDYCAAGIKGGQEDLEGALKSLGYFDLVYEETTFKECIFPKDTFVFQQIRPGYTKMEEVKEAFQDFFSGMEVLEEMGEIRILCYLYFTDLELAIDEIILQYENNIVSAVLFEFQFRTYEDTLAHWDLLSNRIKQFGTFQIEEEYDRTQWISDKQTRFTDSAGTCIEVIQRVSDYCSRVMIYSGF